MRRAFLSVCGVGYLKPAPGTWGSMAAFPLAWLILAIGGPFTFVAAILLVSFWGIQAIAREMEESGAHDPGWIVIDEVAGQWIALLPVAFGAWSTGLTVTELWPGIVTAFAAFRLFDIWKPWLVGRADRRDDATGVMLDDIWAGIFAACVVIILATLAHGSIAILGSNLPAPG
ncbi:MAG: phosphatidylglycerophosphatase A [Pseudomonadota bacterium]